ncbi:MAG: hypothetical protein QOJ23_2903 [Actinomycetota bacterium]|jgi:hypothetical protein|nr:hypothetical protein [Actinomycetota bacterium]
MSVSGEQDPGKQNGPAGDYQQQNPPSLSAHLALAVRRRRHASAIGQKLADSEWKEIPMATIIPGAAPHWNAGSAC